MSDFCDCSRCPQHCGNDEEIEEGVEAQEKVKKLEEDIAALGFKVEETEDGIKVSN